MMNKRLRKIMGTLSLTAFLMGGVVSNINITNAYAYTATYDYSRTYDMVPQGTSLEWFNANSITVTQEQNPNLFTDDIVGYGSKVLNESILPLDGKIYHWRQDLFGAGFVEVYEKALSYKCSSEVNVVEISYQRSEVALSGTFYVGNEKQTMRKNDKELYDYLKSLQTTTPSTPVETTPSVPTTPTTPVETTPSVPTTPVVTKSTTRLGGATRIDTSIAIANSAKITDKFNSVILASAMDFPDALAGGVLSKKYDAPILLVNKTVQASSTTLNYVKSNLKAGGKIIVLGGTGVIDNSVVDSLKASGFTDVTRLGGANRFETNMQIISNLGVATGTNVIVSYALDFPDALSVSPVSSINGMPIILVNGSLTQQVKDFLATVKPTNIYITGSAGVVSSQVESVLKGYSSNVVRLGGANRYETSNAINNYFNLQGSTAVLASGMDFPDALSGTYLAMKNNAPIVLSHPNNNSLQQQFISGKGKSKVYVLGGTGAVSDSVVSSITK